jgi:hypothetical protein
MAALLRRHGAISGGATMGPEEAFLAASMRLDRPAAQALLDAHPELRQSPKTMFAAADRDRPDVLALLLDLGVPLEIADEHNARALHHAAGHNALGAAQFLIDRGAEIDPRDSRWGGTPIGWAAHGDRQPMMDFLSKYSRNVWTLTFRGYVDRLREVLRDEPARAMVLDSDGDTPLWWLPDDETKAMAIVELLLAAGVDPATKNRAGRPAADWARKRGDRSRVGWGSSDAEAPRRRRRRPTSRNARSREDLIFAFETVAPIRWPA